MWGFFSLLFEGVNESFRSVKELSNRGEIIIRGELHCLQTQVTSIYKTCAHVCADIDYQWTVRFHAQLCQDIKEGLSNGMWPPHTQTPDPHCSLLVSMACPWRLYSGPCRQNFGHHAVTLLLTFLYCVTVTMLLICVHIVLPHVILCWLREGLIHKYQPSVFI